VSVGGDTMVWCCEPPQRRIVEPEEEEELEKRWLDFSWRGGLGRGSLTILL
jgi:hypothetical protein